MHFKCGQVAYDCLSPARCNASVGVSSALYLLYFESLNRSVMVLLLAAEVVLVTYDVQWPLR